LISAFVFAEVEPGKDKKVVREARKIAGARVRMGKHQEIETLINEEALLFAQNLRNEKQTWIPRVVNLN